MDIGRMIAEVIVATLLLPQDPAEELKALESQYGKALDAHFEALEKVKDREAWDAQFRASHPARAFGPRFAALSRKARGTEPGFRAGMRLIEFASLLNDEASLRATLEDLSSAHRGSPLLEEMIPYATLAIYKRWGWGEEFLLRIAKEETRPLQAVALYYLGVALAQYKDSSTEQRDQGLRLLRKVRSDFPESPQAKQVDGFFFEREHLQVGKTPPDFEATDQDGSSFRLSDYRGKVLLIDFWGFW